MHNLRIETLQELLENGRKAVKYAWEHYDNLKERGSTYTLYGPYSYGIGAGLPCELTPKHERKLSKQTRRKHYTIYELDSNYNLLRVISMRDYTSIECIYYCFTLDGVQYAYPFRQDQKCLFKDEAFAIRYENSKLQYMGIISRNYIHANFYEHVSDERVIVNSYVLSTVAQHTVHGYPVDWGAPIGALNSPVQHGCWEENVVSTDFSQWLK